jgi:hypothetical protein
LQTILNQVAQSASDRPPADLIPRVPPAGLIDLPIPQLARKHMGIFIDSAELLGRRTGELHVALARETTDADFRPEPFTPELQRHFADMAIGEFHNTLDLASRPGTKFSEEVRPLIRRFEKLKANDLKVFSALTDRPIAAQRTRVRRRTGTIPG